MGSILGAGHFQSDQIGKLKDIAGHLAPHAEEIVNGWVEKQIAFSADEILPREKLSSLFTTLFYGTLDALKSGNIDQYLTIQLPIIGKSLPESGFSYESLIISVHFLEETYLPFLSEIAGENASGPEHLEIYLTIDEFWHFWMAQLTTSYFYEVKRSLTEEVELGRSIQKTIMPEIPEKIGRLEVGTFYASATVGAIIGGDIYDVVKTDNKVLHLLVSDFSGKGLWAAANASRIRAMFRGFAIEDDSPRVVASRLNRVLFNELNENEFDTAFFARLDQASRTVRYVNAGHLGPVLIKPGGTTTILREGENIALGIVEEAEFKEEAFVLDRDAVMIVFTDGIAEARSGKTLFGTRGIAASAGKNLTKSASGIAEAVWKDCLDFANGKIGDDAAILVIRYGE